VNTTVFPSFENVAPCQYANRSSWATAVRFGFAGSLMSIRIPLPSHAPAAMSSAGNTVMSWHASLTGVGLHVVSVLEGCRGVGGEFWSTLSCPVAGSPKSRASFTTAASSGAASGTLITSICHRDSSWSNCGVASCVASGGGIGTSLQLASSVAERTLPVPLTYT
jgi:hypothetical protein